MTTPAGLDNTGREPKLTLEAEKAVRSYLLKLVVPGGAIITIVSGLLGYVGGGMVKIEALTEARQQIEHLQHLTLEAAGSAATAKNTAQAAADQAAESKARLVKALEDIEETRTHLIQVKDQVDAIINNKYDELAKALFNTADFRKALGSVGDRQLKDINDQLELMGLNTVLASGVIKGGQLSGRSRDVKFDPNTGKITFPNRNNMIFTPVVSSVSSNGVYQTENCYARSVGTDSFVLWQGPLETGSRNHAPTDCTFVVIGARS
jgi:hypothetical protein